MDILAMFKRHRYVRSMPPQIIFGIYACVSLITFIAYGLDKRNAVRGARRTPEPTLHLLELAGGWPGALVAQAVFAHKRRKKCYMLTFATIVAVHLVAWAIWFWKH